MMLSRSDAAKYLGISASTLDGLCHNRAIAYYQARPGGRVRFDRADLDAFLARSRHPAHPAR